MRLALREAARAPEHDDVPIGAVVVRGGEVIGVGHNERELRADPTAHAEMIALREAARAVGSWRVLDSVMYVTLEPCAMCAGAIVLARLPRLVFGAADPKAGAGGSVLNVLDEPRLNHRPQVESGLLAEECADLLRAFFAPAGASSGRSRGRVGSGASGRAGQRAGAGGRRAGGPGGPAGRGQFPAFQAASRAGAGFCLVERHFPAPAPRSAW